MSFETGGDMMADSEKVTVSFVMDRKKYEEYKQIVMNDGKSVKGDLVRYMNETIKNNK